MQSSISKKKKKVVAQKTKKINTRTGQVVERSHLYRTITIFFLSKEGSYILQYILQREKKSVKTSTLFK